MEKNRFTIKYVYPTQAVSVLIAAIGTSLGNNTGEEHEIVKNVWRVKSEI